MRIPRHIALIPDGNRRWAREKGLKPWEGHKAGIDRFREFLDWCFGSGVKEVTAYSLSRENLSKRSRAEVDFLFKLHESGFRDLLESPDIKEREVRVEFAGELGKFPKSLAKLIKDVEEQTGKFNRRRLTLCLNYSGRKEILRAFKGLAESGKPITEKGLEGFLQVKSAPDLVIRTAEKRISNFLLWQSAYSELYFSDKLFPDFCEEDLRDAIAQFNKTERRFGR